MERDPVATQVAPPAGPVLTRFEKDRLERGLAELRRIRSRDLPELLRAARGLVKSDAAEEIAQIREDFAAVDSQIETLGRLLNEARVVEEGWLGADTAGPGREVSVRYVRSGRVRRYVLSGTAGDASTASVGSPVGQAVLGRRAGDVVSVELPDGKVEQLEILAVVAPRADSEADAHVRS